MVTNENLKLKKAIKDLNTRIEFIDRKTRASNIVINGLKCGEREWTKVCSDILKVSTIPQLAVKIGKNMDSPATIQTVLAA